MVRVVKRVNRLTIEAESSSDYDATARAYTTCAFRVWKGATLSLIGRSGKIVKFSRGAASMNYEDTRVRSGHGLARCTPASCHA